MRGVVPGTVFKHRLVPSFMQHPRFAKLRGYAARRISTLSSAPVSSCPRRNLRSTISCVYGFSEREPLYRLSCDISSEQGVCHLECSKTPSRRSSLTLAGCRRLKERGGAIMCAAHPRFRSGHRSLDFLSRLPDFHFVSLLQHTFSLDSSRMLIRQLVFYWERGRLFAEDSWNGLARSRLSDVAVSPSWPPKSLAKTGRFWTP